MKNILCDGILAHFKHQNKEIIKANDWIKEVRKHEETIEKIGVDKLNTLKYHRLVNLVLERDQNVNELMKTVNSKL